MVFLVIDALFHHMTQDLDLVNGCHTHTEIAFQHILIHDGTGNAHTPETDLEVGFATHGRHGNSSAAKAQQLILNVLRNPGKLITILNLNRGTRIR